MSARDDDGDQSTGTGPDADQSANDVDGRIAGTVLGRATGAESIGRRFADDDTDTPDTAGDDAVASGADPESTSSS